VFVRFVGWVRPSSNPPFLLPTGGPDTNARKSLQKPVVFQPPGRMWFISPGETGAIKSSGKCRVRSMEVLGVTRVAWKRSTTDSSIKVRRIVYQCTFLSLTCPSCNRSRYGERWHLTEEFGIAWKHMEQTVSNRSAKSHRI